MIGEHSQSIVVIAAFLLNLFCIAIGGLWKMTRVEASLREAISKSHNEVDGKIDQVDKRIDTVLLQIVERIDQQYRNFGETAAAIRTKITEVELFSRDTFMRRDSFYKVQETIEGNFKDFADKIDKRLERMENKIDTKT